ncbi:glycosyltransferase [Streptomyces brevispora]|uniref:glycosyltransferase n=1 Tax=Streptomyces brevispora TaxID=887462 RepID=UPI003720BE1F
MNLGELLKHFRRDTGRPTGLAADLLPIASLSPSLAAAPLPVDDWRQLADRYETHRTASVTAAVLTCNEEDNIGNCLTSLVDDADRVLLIDSGSTDKTVDAARRARADVRVLVASWVDDFAHHRNIALSETTDGWVWYVDADEVLASADAGRVRRVLSALDFLLPHLDLVVSPTIVDTDGTTYCNTQRVLRADTAHRFRGRVHEHPYDDAGYAPARVEIDCRFTHSGYRPEVMEQRGKREEYGRLLAMCRKEEPDNPKWVYYLVRDTLDYRTATPDRLRALFGELATVAKGAVDGRPDYHVERTADSWALLCELALRFGGTEEILEYTGLLQSVDRTVEATYYRTVMEAGRLIGRLSALVDGVTAAEADRAPATQHLMGRLFELQATLALASGRYEVVRPAYEKAARLGVGSSVIDDFRMLRQLLDEISPADDSTL